MAIISSQPQPAGDDDRPKSRQRKPSADRSARPTMADTLLDPTYQAQDDPEPEPGIHRPHEDRPIGHDRPRSAQAKPKPSQAEPPTSSTGTNRPDDSLRPQRLAEYIGQKDLKAVLEIAIAAAQGRSEPLDHLLLYGPPGLGKTTMALILAGEMGSQCKITTAPALERPRDIAGLVVNLEPGDLLFIDEIHRLSRVTEEILYPVMEDFRLDVTIGKGQSARTRSLPLPPFTLVGATTQVGALSSPLRDRFGLIQRLRFYEPDELSQIILRTARILQVAITEAGAAEIARRSRGTPRIANRLLRRVRDYAQVKGHPTRPGHTASLDLTTLDPTTDPATVIDEPIACAALECFNVDPRGLDWVDRRLLGAIIEQFAGGPVGLETLAAATGEDSHTIEEVYEPYLMQIGYLQRTPRGRIATAAAWRHLGYQPPAHLETQLSLLDR